MRSLTGMGGKRFGTLTLIILLPLLTVGASAQAPKDSTQPSGDTGTVSPQTPAAQDPKAAETVTQTTAKSVPMTPEEARQAQLVADTNKLFQLAEELKAEVAKSNKDTLSLAVVRKAAEVEKLAKSLKERMKSQ